MGPNSQQEFIIVLKVPQKKQTMNLVSQIQVKLRTEHDTEMVERSLRRSFSTLDAEELEQKKTQLRVKTVLLAGLL